MLGHTLLFIVPTSFTPLRLFSLILPSDVEGNRILNFIFLTLFHRILLFFWVETWIHPYFVIHLRSVSRVMA
ncbi:vacuolar cation/proton exchanger 1a [Iris pallida]|uniref:Vacuolar cation/proton exchanger 1a n=1 Tax=Iris pallida TaxID=29817 RepID=A0AAX6DQH5_IRIPA|nr:vacuolar cation/proton exchanger 1a [Iris pallida]